MPQTLLVIAFVLFLAGIVILVVLVI